MPYRRLSRSERRHLEREDHVGGQEELLAARTVAEGQLVVDVPRAAVVVPAGLGANHEVRGRLPVQAEGGLGERALEARLAVPAQVQVADARDPGAVLVAEPLDAAADRELRVDLVDQVLIQSVPLAIAAGAQVGASCVPKLGCTT